MHSIAYVIHWRHASAGYGDPIPRHQFEGMYW